MIAAPLFGWSVGQFGVRATLGGLATILAVTGSISAWLIAQSGVTLAAAAASIAPRAAERRRPVFWRLWIVFFLAASAGLMVLSQAAAIILPITAGYLFDLTRGYGSAVLIAAGGNALGILVALGLPHQRAARADAPLQSTATGSVRPAKGTADG